MIPPTWPVDDGEHPVNFTLAESIQLTGYDIKRQGEQALDITLHWKSLARVDRSYTAFVHLLNARGELVAQSDVLPAQGLFPTSAWQPGDVVLSQHTLALPADIPPGDYTLTAGLYHAGDGARLSVVDSHNILQPNEAAPIGQVEMPK